MTRHVTVTNVTYCNKDEYLVLLNEPKQDDLSQKPIVISGFVCHRRNHEIITIEITAKAVFGRQVIGTTVLKESPVFAQNNLQFVYGERARFDIKINTAFLYESETLELFVVLSGGQKEIIARLEVETQSDSLNAHNETYSPLKLLSLGRTGTTLFMNMISAHPEVCINNHFNESNIASYFLNFILHSYPYQRAEAFTEGSANLKNIEVIQNHGFMEFPFITNDGWYSDHYPKKLITFVKSTIDDYYGNVAEEGTRFFIEKGVVHDPTLSLMDNLYKDAKYIFLVRDFRDMYASILNFNSKRGYKAFGMENYETDEAYIRALGHYCNNHFIKAYESIKHRALLVKYEDVIFDKAGQLQAIFDYLNVESSTALVNEIIEKTSGKSMDEKQHVTTNDPKRSIGKYRETLDGETIILLNECFDKSLEYFGYEMQD